MTNRDAAPSHSSQAAGAPTDPRDRGEPRISLVIPIYNEEETIPFLWRRLQPVLDSLAGGAEVIFTDDGSRDRSFALLCALADADPRIIVIAFNRNYGQHAAVLAGLGRARGDIVVTMDADLQDPPEEIPHLLAKLDEGFDVVGGARQRRRTHPLRRAASWLNNRVMARAVGVDIHDFGCMLRAYRRPIIDAMLRCPERSAFIPGLASRFARRSAEIPVAHDDRAAGRSKYSLAKLLRLQADLVIGFASIPFWSVSLAGGALVAGSIALGLAVVVALGAGSRGPLAEPLLGLAAALAAVQGVTLVVVGLVGEHVARVHDEVRDRPRSIVREVVGPGAAAPAASAAPVAGERAPGRREAAGSTARRPT